MPERPVVERHELNGFALAAGLLCLAFSGLTLASRADLFQVDGLVVLASVWVVLGVVGVSRAVYRLVSGPRKPTSGDAPVF